MIDLECLEFVAKHAPMPATFDTRKTKIRRNEELIAARGIQPLCESCLNTCKVLRGSSGLEQNFECYEFNQRGGKE